MGTIRRGAKQQPVVILLGSGIHREILGPQWQCSPLASWEELLRETARRARIPLSLVVGDSLTASWETMVLEGMTNGFRDERQTQIRPFRCAAAEVDLALRRVCSQVIGDHSADRARHYKNHWVTQCLSKLCQSRQVHLVDFNFDTLIGNSVGMAADSPVSIGKPPRSSGLTTEEHAALCRSWPLPGPHSSRVRKPHGWFRRPRTLRLGVRDFGLQGAGYRWAFGHHKAAERNHAANKSIHSETWVARVLRYECRAIGLGLGRDEWGLHWLLVQRARDRAGKKPERPFTSYNEIRGAMPIGVGHSGHPSWEAAIRAAFSGD